MVAGRDSYQDFHKEGPQRFLLFHSWLPRWLQLRAISGHGQEMVCCEWCNGVCWQFTQGKVSTLHLHQGHIELQKNCLHFIFPPKLLSQDQRVSSILKFHKQAFIKQQKGWDLLLGQVVTVLWTSLVDFKTDPDLWIWWGIDWDIHG